MEKGLREQPFPDAILREMGIRLPSSMHFPQILTSADRFIDLID